MQNRSLSWMILALLVAGAASLRAQSYTVSNITNDFATHNISTTGTTLVGGAGTDDGEEVVNFPTGFVFPFYGTQHSAVMVNSNGWVSFGPSQGLTAVQMRVAPTTAPDPTIPNNFIAGNYDDLNPAGAGGQVKVQHLTGPSRFVILWDSVAHFGSTTAFTHFAIVLFETGAIEIHYSSGQSITGTVGVAVGIENATGTSAAPATASIVYVPQATDAFRWTLPAVDLDVVSVTTDPVTPKLGKHDVIVRLQNNGSNTLTGNANVQYTLNGGTPVAQIVALSGLVSGATVDVLFTGASMVDIPVTGAYTLAGAISPVFTGDVDATDSFSFPFLVSGPTATVTVGTGTTSAASMNPIYRSAATSAFDHSGAHLLYTAADLAAIPSGATITELFFNKTNNGASTSADNILQVYLKNSSLTSITTADTWGNITTGATLVYSSNTFQMPATVGWVSLGQFTTPFTYTGGSIEVAILWNCSANAGSPSTGAFNWQYSSVSNRGRNYNNTTPVISTTSLGNTTVSSNLRLPNIQFSYGSSGPNQAPGVSLPASSVFTGNTVSGLSATVGQGQALSDLVFELADPDFDAVDLNAIAISPSAIPGVTLNRTAPTTGLASGITVEFSGAIGSTQTPGNYVYTFTIDDNVNSAVTFTVTITIINPAPTLTPATGSAFGPTLGLTIALNTALANASLVAADNAATIDITVSAISAAPGVTAPSSVLGAATPATLTWTGTPTAAGTYSYSVTLNDGVNNQNFVVTLEVPYPTLIVGTTTGTTTNAFPFNYGNGNGRFQTAYTATEVNLPTGAVIRRVRVLGSWSATTAPQYTNLRLRLAHTTLLPADLTGVYDDNYIGEFSTVLDAATYSPVAEPISTTQAWWTFQLSEPFFYNGVDNLLVDWSMDGRTGTGFGVGSGAGRDRVFQNGGSQHTFGGSSTDTGNYGLEISYDVNLDGLLLMQRGASGIARVSGAQTDLVVWDAQARTISTSRNITSMTFTRTGTLADNQFTSVRLIRDDNNNGVVDGTDTQLGTGTLASGEITFTGGPLVSLTVGSPIRLLLAVDLPSTATAGGTFVFGIAADTDLSFGTGSDYTTYPANGIRHVIFSPVQIGLGSSWTQDFEGTQPMRNFVEVLGPGTFPQAASATSTPTTVLTTVNGIVDIAQGPLNTNMPRNSSTRMLSLHGHASGSASAAEFHFDMSGLTTTNLVELSFWYNDAGIDTAVGTDPYNFIFLSTNGGTTWQAVVWDFPEGGTESTWNFVQLNLSDVMNQFSLTYTANMVIRFQIAETITTEYALFDDIAINVPAAQLLFTASTTAPATATSALTSDQWVGTFDMDSINSNQSLSSLTFTNIGTLSSTQLASLKLWVDTNSTGLLDTGDTQLGSTVASMSGDSVTFTGAPLLALTNSQGARLFVSVQVAATATPANTIRFEITASTAVAATPGAITGTFPIQGGSVNVVNPAPTLVPATGSGFDITRSITVTINQPLTNAVLSAGDTNNSSVAITVVGTTPAPGVTQPSNSASAAVPANLAWTGTPTSLGTYTYNVTISDGINSPNFNVVIDVVNPPPTLVPATGSGFVGTSPITYSAIMGDPLVNATLVANDINNATVAITITSTLPAPNVTQPANQASAAVPFNLTWTGTPSATGNYDYNVNINDGVNNVNFTVRIEVSNPPPTLVPATGSAFTITGALTRQYAAQQNVALANAVLTVNDLNDATVAITITTALAAPGVTQPADNAAASVPFNLTWTNTPTTVGTYSYNVNINDGTNNVNFTVTFNVTNPAPTLVPATGSAFNAARTYAGLKNTALANAVLTANDVNEPTVAITITAVTAAPGVTQPANNAAATVPFNLTWTGTPTSHGTFTYTVTVSDGVNTPQNFTVTFNIAHPALSGTYTISQTLAADFTDIGEVFDVMEASGITGAVVLEIIDSATYVSTPAYSLGINSETVIASQVLTPVSGASATNTITLRAAAGQSPRVQGSATGAVLFKSGTTLAQTGRGGLVINQSFVTVEGLEVFGGPDFGIMTQGNNVTGVLLNPTNITVRGCTVYDIPNGPGIAFMGMNSGWATNYLVEHNFVYNCITTALTATPVLQPNTNGCIVVRNPDLPGTGAIVRHNTVVHTSTVANTAGIYINNSSGARQMADISSNVVVVTNSTTVPALYLSTATHAPATANYNVWFATTHCNLTTHTPFATWQGLGYDAAGSNANPMLVSTTAPFDLHLQASSIAIDRATGSTATIDIDGNVRPAGRAADSGAHEAQVPEIEVLQATTTVNYNTTINLGNVATTGSTFTFTIENNGVTDLILSGTPTVQATILSNLDPGSGVTVQPALTTIAANGSTTFDVFIDPTINLAFSLSISIANNDFDRAPFIFTISGTGFTPNGDAQATTATGSSFTGGTNGPFSMAVNPGTVLANASISLTDPELDNITVTAITATTTLPAGITAPAIPAVGQPLTLTWTGTANATNTPGPYTWQVTFQDAGNGTPVSVLVTIIINDVPPAHVILNATGGNGGAGNPYTAFWTATQNAGAMIDMATVTDANTSQLLSLGTIIPGGTNPAGGSGFTIALTAGLLRVSPTAALVAADVGVHTFNVPVTDGTNNVNVHLSLTVNAAPIITTVSPLTDGEQGVSYTALQFVASGGTGALTWTVTGGSLPSGMTLTGAGLFSGIPTLAGVYNFNLTATDSVGVFHTAAFQITIDPPAAGNPSITTTSPLLGGIVGNSYGPVTITAAGGTPGYSFSIVSGSLPAGLSMSAGGIITGTPSVQGTATFDVRVTDAALATDTDTFSITIATVPGSGGGGGGGGGGGCAAEGSSTSTLWGLLLGMPALMYLARRRRAARK